MGIKGREEDGKGDQKEMEIWQGVRAVFSGPSNEFEFELRPGRDTKHKFLLLPKSLPESTLRPTTQR